MLNNNINRYRQDCVDTGLLDPLEWSEIALKSDSEAATIVKLFKSLASCGFENGAYVYQETQRNAQASFGVEFRYFGEILSPSWQHFTFLHPELGAANPMRCRLSTGNNSVVKLASIGIVPSLSKNEQHISDLYKGFGFTAGIAFLSHDGKQENFASLLLYVMDKTDSFVTACTPKTIRSIHLTTAYISEVFRIKEMARSDETPKLSDREQECLTWSAIGCSTKEIADTLNLADATVNEYFTGAMNKLHARTRTQACARAYLLKLISP